MDFERLMAAEAVDFVQPSVAKMGGICDLIKIFPAAATRNVTVMPHLFYDGPAFQVDSFSRGRMAAQAGGKSSPICDIF